MRLKSEENPTISSIQSKIIASDITADFEPIKPLLRSHYKYLLSHQLYIDSIKNNQIGDADIEAYAKDVFGMNVTANKFKESLIVLTSTIKDRVETIKLLYKIIGLENKSAAVALHLYLEYLITVNHEDKKLIAKGDFPTSDKAQLVFHAPWLFTQLKALAEEFVPYPADKLSNLYKIKVITTEKKSSSSAAYSSRVTFNFRLKGIYDDIVTLLPKSSRILSTIEDKSRSSASANEMEKESYLYELMTKFDVLIERHKLIVQKINGAEQNDLAVGDGLIMFSNYFTQAENVLSELKAVINYYEEQIALTTGYNKYITHAKETLSNFEKSYIVAESKYKEHSTKLTDTCTEINHYSALLTTIETGIAELRKFCAIAVNNTYELKSIKNEFSKISNNIHHSFNALNNLETQLNSIEKRAKKTKTKESTNSSNLSQKHHIEKQNVVNVESSSQNVAFLLKQAEKTKEYKEKVKNRREIKQQNKVIENSQEVNNSNNKDNKTVYKNMEMDLLLKALSSKKLQLVKSILNLEKGIKYEDVYNLICNKLHGQINEVGNGSSHKRMQIAKYLIEVTTTCTLNTNKVPNQVGGVQKPHGGSHNSGALSPFNVEAVKRLFVEAGITLEQIEKLEKSKELERNTKNSSVNFFSNGNDGSFRTTNTSSKWHWGN